jgi:hypothetical protein
VLLDQEWVSLHSRPEEVDRAVRQELQVSPEGRLECGYLFPAST